MKKRLKSIFMFFLSFVMLMQISFSSIFAATSVNTTATGSVSDEILYGDLNGDRLINSIDLALINRYIKGSISSLPNNVTLKAADINFDGKIDTQDSAILNKVILNKLGITIQRPRILLETPASAATLSENIDVKGWALDVYGVAKVELLVNGNAAGTAVYGDARTDIQNKYPGYKNANSGYHFDFDTTKFANGSYTLAVRETNSLGIATTSDAITIKIFNPFDIRLNCQATDAAMDTAKDIMYITDKNAKKLYSVNCKTKEVSSVSFDLSPESVCFKNGKVYVALLKTGHVYYSEQAEQGAIAVVDADSMKIENQIDVDIDPFDIEVLDNNYIIISSGSNQLTNIKCYSLISKQEVSSSDIDMQSYIEYNSYLNRIYTIDTDLSPRDYHAYNISSGKFTDPIYPGGYDSPYHGDYPLNKLFRISPDGKYLFNSSGVVFTCDSSKANDMKYAATLNKSFADIAFNGVQKFYTAVGNGLINEYNYSDFKGINSYSVKSNPVKLYYVDNQLIVLGNATLNGNQKYGIEIVNTTKTLPTNIVLESPANGSDVSENVNIKGWALDTNGIAKVEILVNGNVAGTAVYGDARSDIQTAYPDYNNANAGFHYDLDTTKFSNGIYTLAVKVTNTNGAVTTTGTRTINIKNYFDISLSCQVTDTVMDTASDVMYITDKSAKKLYSVNCKTKEVSSVSFDLSPESVYFKNGKVYVALLKKEHNADIDEKDEQGAIAIVDAASMKIDSQMDVNIDPFDIEVLDDNYIVISSGSSQWTNIKCYSLTSKQEVSSSTIRQQSYIEYNSFLKRLYTIDTDVSPRDYTAYNISSGKFTDPSYPGGYDSPYHGDYDLGKLFRISPDGNYLFNSSGVVFACDSNKSNDMKYAKTLNSSFIDIAFNGTKNLYTVGGNGLINEYNYSDFKGTNSYSIKSNPVKLYYVDNQLIVVGNATLNGNQKSGIELIDLPKPLPTKISIDKPADGAVLNDTTTISGWALDESGVAKIEILLNGNSVGTAVYGDARSDIQTTYPDYKNAYSGYHFDLDTTKFINGSYKLSVRVTNNLGIATTTDARTINIKNPFDISLNCQITDTAIDEAKDVLYITDKNAKKLYAVNSKTREINSVSFDLPPESVSFKNGKIYVALLKQEHTYDMNSKAEQGAIAVVDADSMQIENQVDVDIDPFDIEVLDGNYIIISSGSDQFTKIKCYSLISKKEVSSSSIRMQSYIEYNSFLNRLYTIDTDVSPRDYTAYNISFGNFTDPSYPGGYDSPYHGDYDLGKLFKISPDGKYLFNSSGVIFACDASKTNDMKYVGTLNKNFIDIAFNGTTKFYTAVSNSLIYEYNYSDFQGTNAYSIVTNLTNLNKLYYVNNQLIVLGTITQNGNQKSGIIIVSLP